MILFTTISLKVMTVSIALTMEAPLFFARRAAIRIMAQTIFRNFNPWVLFDGSLLQLGLNQTEINILSLAMVILIIATLIFGVCNTLTATTMSDLTKGYDPTLLTTLVISVAVTILFSAVKMISAKYSRLCIQDKIYMSLLTRVLNSRMSDIVDVNTGKIFDAVHTGYRAGLKV